MESKEMNFKKWMESKAYDNQKEIIRKEVNSFPLIIDRACFKKTPEERIKLYNLRKKWQQEERIRVEQLKKLQTFKTKTV